MKSKVWKPIHATVLYNEMKRLADYILENNQFRERQEKISEETVRASPEKYLEYIPKEEKSTEQKFAEQAEQIEMLKDCLLEMSELVYA